MFPSTNLYFVVAKKDINIGKNLFGQDVAEIKKQISAIFDLIAICKLENYRNTNPIINLDFFLNPFKNLKLP